MENTKAAILVLAIVASVAVTASATYATMGRQTVATPAYGYGTGQSMMGGSGYGGMMGGYSGYSGMMGGNGTMGAYCDQGDMNQSMLQYMKQYWNSTSTS